MLVCALAAAAIIALLVTRQQKGGPLLLGTTVVAEPDAGADVASDSNRTAARERLMDDRTSTRAPPGFVAEHESNREALIACMEEKQCPPGTICKVVGDELGCYGSNCKDARDTKSCGDGKSCVIVVGVEGIIWRCVPAGAAGLGESCIAGGLRPPRKQRCVHDLRCWGGRCRALCESNGTCRSGSCVKTIENDDDSVCVDDSCKSHDDCPGENVCMPIQRNPTLVKTCLKLTAWPDGTRSCLPGRCPAGMACDGVYIGSAFRGKCRQICSAIPELRCQDGYVCGMAGFIGYSDAPSVCYRRCDVFNPAKATCDPGEKCRTTTEQMTTGDSGCAPEFPMASFAAEPEMDMDSILGDPVAKPGESSSIPPAEKDGP